MLRENDIKLFLYENCAVFRSQVLFIGIIEYICAIYNAENKIVNHVRAKLFTKIYSWLSITQTFGKSNLIQTLVKTFDKSDSFTGPFRPKFIKIHNRSFKMFLSWKIFVFVFLKIAFSPFRIRVIESQLYANKNRVIHLSFWPPCE